MLNAGTVTADQDPDQHRVVRDGNGKSRLEAERSRLAKIKAAATPPIECGWMIPTAPGRGGFVKFIPTALQENGKGEMVNATTGYAGRHAIRATDVFDQMIAAAQRAKKDWPLTPGQIAIGRRYRDLVEWRAAGGIKCSSIDGRVAGSSDRDFMDTYLSAGRELDGMRRRIGAGVAMQVRRVRPSQRGMDARKPFTSRDVVDMVCVSGLTIKQVLNHFGWQTNGRNCKAALETLRDALDRMIGYRCEKSS